MQWLFSSIHQHRTLLAYILFGCSALWYAGFWVWAMIHAWLTPKAVTTQKLFWSGSMFINPSTAVWYWYVWKRWAFWVLFTPIFGFFISLPFIVRSLLTTNNTTNLANALSALGSPWVVVFFSSLLIFPFILRLAALFHLGRNGHLSAMDRNDWVVSFAMPIVGFGAGIAYCARYQRTWALISLGWWICMFILARIMVPNIMNALVPAGEEKREQLKIQASI